jgi:hypothetical protein
MVTDPAEQERPGDGPAPRPAGGLRAEWSAARPPAEVHRAFLALVGYLAVSVLSVVVSQAFAAAAVVELPSGGVTPRFVVFTAALYLAALVVMVKMRAGQHWARVTLSVLGALGLAVIVLNTVVLLANAAGYGLAYSAVFLVISLAQIALLAAALVLMYRPAAAAYFG